MLYIIYVKNVYMKMLLFTKYVFLVSSNQITM